MCHSLGKIKAFQSEHLAQIFLAPFHFISLQAYKIIGMKRKLCIIYLNKHEYLFPHGLLIWVESYNKYLKDYWRGRYSTQNLES